MEYTKLGNTDIEISRLCLGCMSFGKAGTMHDWTLDEAESEKIIRHALDAGINFFDTANEYSAETSEESKEQIWSTRPDLYMKRKSKLIHGINLYDKKQPHHQKKSVMWLSLYPAIVKPFYNQYCVLLCNSVRSDSVLVACPYTRYQAPIEMISPAPTSSAECCLTNTVEILISVPERIKKIFQPIAFNLLQCSPAKVTASEPTTWSEGQTSVGVSN